MDSEKREVDEAGLGADGRRQRMITTMRGKKERRKKKRRKKGKRKKEKERKRRKGKRIL